MKLLSKKIVLIHSNHHPESPGGIEYVVRMLLDLLEESAIDTLCFYGGKDSTQERFYRPNVGIIGRKVIIKVAGASFLSFGNLSFLYKALNAKLVIFQEPYPGLWPAMFIIRYVLRIPTIVLFHANPVSTPLVMKAYSFFRELTFRGSACITTSPNLLSQVGSKKYISNQVIPLCVSDRISPYIKSMNLPDRYVLYIGRLGNYKGLNYLVEVAAMQPEIFFVIAGDGPLSRFIANAINTKALKNILFLNRFILESEKYELIERSEFLVFPSTSQNEAFGLVQLEAMRAGKPLINTWLNSGVNYVAPNDVCAITVEKCNSQALSSAIKYLWNDKDLTVRLGSLASLRYEELFTRNKFRDSWLDLIKSTVNI
jgi:glycosyltransferase involved in cell wall biosynthesis